MLNDVAIRELRRVSKIHADWLIYVILGPELLLGEELMALQFYGKLPLDQNLDLVTLSYFLGKKNASLKTTEYSKLTYDSLDEGMVLSDIEKKSLFTLRLHAVTEIRRVSNAVSDSLLSKIHTCYLDSQGSYTRHPENYHSLDACIVGHVAELKEKVFGKFTLLFSNLFSLAVTDLLNVSKNQAILDAVSGGEGMFTEGLKSKVLVKHRNSLEAIPAVDLLSKNLSFFQMNYIPAGTDVIDGKLVIVDEGKWEEAIAKAKAGVSGGISSTVAPTGPPQPKTPASPGSLPGAPAPGNVAGPGKPKSGGSSLNLEYAPRGAKPEGEGWEQVIHSDGSVGGWKRQTGLGGKGAPSQEEQRQMKQKAAEQWGKQPRSASEHLSHLSHGKIDTLKELSEDEKGASISYRVTIEDNGRGLMKPTESGTAEDFDEMWGDGWGSVPRGAEHAREAAAHNLSGLLGTDHVPPTTTRAYGGESQSVQAWQEGHDTPSNTLSDDLYEVYEENETQAILDHAGEHSERIKESLKEIIVMDIVMNNNDRHTDNVVISEDGSSLKAIDHGNAFGVGVKGYKNEFHKDFHKMKTPVTIPDKMKTQLENKTLGDYKRALSDQLSDWEIGQTYLRGRYALHLQETEGHLDHEKFKNTIDSYHGNQESPNLTPPDEEGGEWKLAPEWKVGNSSDKGWADFKKRKDEKTLPNDLFNSYAKELIYAAKDNPEHPDHAVAKQLDEIGVFMAPEGTKDPKGYRRADQHRGYERSIRRAMPAAQIGSKKPLATVPPPAKAGTTVPPPGREKPDKKIDPFGATLSTKRTELEQAKTMKERRDRGIDRRATEGTPSQKTIDRRKNPRGRRRQD